MNATNGGESIEGADPEADGSKHRTRPRSQISRAVARVRLGAGGPGGLEGLEG